MKQQRMSANKGMLSKVLAPMAGEGNASPGGSFCRRLIPGIIGIPTLHLLTPDAVCCKSVGILHEGVLYIIHCTLCGVWNAQRFDWRLLPIVRSGPQEDV